MPAAGIFTTPLAVCPASATIVVPSSKVMLCWIAPVFASSTRYAPASATVTMFGLKDRSAAVILIVPCTAPGADVEGAPAGSAIAGAYVQRASAFAVGVQPTRIAMAANVLMTAASRRIVLPPGPRSGVLSPQQIRSAAVRVSEPTHGYSGQRCGGRAGRHLAPCRRSRLPGVGELLERRSRQLRTGRACGPFDGPVHCAVAREVARAAAEHATEHPGIAVGGIDNAKQADRGRRRHETVATGSAGCGRDEAGATEVGQDVGHESRRNAHPFGDVPGAQIPALTRPLVLGKREHGPDGVVTSS